jgi:hypothetical protein
MKVAADVIYDIFAAKLRHGEKSVATWCAKPLRRPELRRRLVRGLILARNGLPVPIRRRA